MLKRHFSAYNLAALAAFVLLAGNGLVVPTAHAQDRRLERVLKKLERLERDMRVINRQLYRRGTAVDARTSGRLERLERDMRVINQQLNRRSPAPARSSGAAAPATWPPGVSPAKDKTPPRIFLISPDVTPQSRVFRVDTYQIIVRGRVQDASGVGVVLVNGKNARIKEDGTFARKVKLTLGTNKMSVKAEDIHGNINERKFAIVREEFIPDDNLADIDLPPKRNVKNPNGIGVVIGIEKYQYVAPATYAYNDAEVMREYLSQTLGFSKARLKLVTNTRATRAELDRLLGPNGWLARNVVKGKSDVVVYYSGHGLPQADRKRVGLLSFDVDPNYSIGLPLDSLYRSLQKLNARSVTVLLDSCFSGQTREKKLLLANARGIVISPKLDGVPNGINVLSAATGGQISGVIKASEHGLFTYYLLKGLGGEADGNRDQKITLSELHSYTSREVKKRASILGWQQTPDFTGDGQIVFSRW